MCQYSWNPVFTRAVLAHPRSSVLFPSSFANQRLSRDMAVSLIEAPAFRWNIIHLFPQGPTVSAREFTGVSPSPYLCDITNVFGIRRSIDSPPNGNASLTFTVSSYKADIEWLPAYAKPMYFLSVFRELVLLSRNNHNRKDDNVSRFCSQRSLADN